MCEISDCMDELEWAIVDIRVEALLNHLLVHSPTIDRYDPEAILFAKDRTSDFLLDYANALTVNYYNLSRVIRQKEKVPASDQLGGQTDAKTTCCSPAP